MKHQNSIEDWSTMLNNQKLFPLNTNYRWWKKNKKKRSDWHTRSVHASSGVDWCYGSDFVCLRRPNPMMMMARWWALTLVWCWIAANTQNSSRVRGRVVVKTNTHIQNGVECTKIVARERKTREHHMWVRALSNATDTQSSASHECGSRMRVCVAIEIDQTRFGPKKRIIFLFILTW